MQTSIAPDEQPVAGAAADPIRALALEHRQVSGGRGFLGAREVDGIRRLMVRAETSLRTARELEPSAHSAIEWLLDNGYLVRRVLGQLRRELPGGFQRRLPALETGEPRALALAEFIWSLPGELAVDDLERFLDSYQETTPLTIAELWALPNLVRWVISRSLAELIGCLLEDRPVDDPGAAAGRAIRALRLLAEIDWKELFCRHSATERALRGDPAGAYAAMDFETRDAYRRAVEEIARTSGRAEIEVAGTVLERARQGPPDGRHDHVGHWLIGGGRRAIERSLGARPSGIERRLLDHPRLGFFGLLALMQLAFIAPIAGYLIWLGAPGGTAALALALSWIPSSVPATAAAHWIFARVVRPRLLPKLDFSEGVPARWRTLVAVPTLLGERSEIDRLVEQLEVHYLSNPDPELRFALVTDHIDSDDPGGDDGAARLVHAVGKLRALNARHGGAREPFHLLHRRSLWNPGEGAWMGWERKRGKLEELNRFLRGATDTSYALHVGSPADLKDVAFVLTLDSDTALPPGAASRLIGTLAHPLNRPQIDVDGRVCAGYTVIQPRVEISPQARSSTFSLLFSGDTGIDIYTRATSEVYQDLFAEGIYVGKGIYDVDAFAASLEGRVPENTLVSHDLFEGITGRAALATDVVVYEDYPPHYPAYLRRMHRWVRGDWQLCPWLLPRVPHADGSRIRNDLSLVDRFKIVDNLRRSLVAPAILALLVGGWWLLPGHPLIWTAAAIGAPGAGALLSLLSRRGSDRHNVGRWFLAVCFVPSETLVVLDAIARVSVRALFTRRRMLEWTTAAEAARRFSAGTRAAYLRALWPGPAAAIAIAGVMVGLTPAALIWASPVLALWALSPELAWRLGATRDGHREAIDEAARRRLRLIARRTWLYFETFAGPGDHWLPPDHFQEDPRGEAAHRSSPTNIGMSLLAQLAAYDLGYIGPAGLAAWASNSLDTMERLAKYRGHLYNWYDTRTLEPLEPRYVSTVDSGNLAGALVALAVGCERLLARPAVPAQLRDGLLDVATLLATAVERWETSGAAGDTVTLIARTLVDRLEAAERCDRPVLEAAIADVDAIDAGVLAGLEREDASHAPALLRELGIWLDRTRHQLDEARLELAMAPEALGSAALPLIEVPGAAVRAGLRTETPPGSERRQGSDALSRAANHAAALAERLRRVAERARALAEAADFGFLYDPERRLFHVGYNATTEHRDPHHYDLLASEARLASFLAIAWRQVPLEHWFALGRPVARVGHHRRALLSWGGSMFEYLMPRLLMRSHRDTLLDESYDAAADRQIAYGREQQVPWGISESGYAFLDGQQAYQYRAFGVPGLGLRRGLAEDVVVAPYACFLALPVRPRQVVANLDHLERLGMLGRFGYYEAADFHPRRAPVGRPGVVRSYMAHHQGMSLVAIANALCGDAMVERFHSEPAVKSFALLLDERVPAEAPAERPITETGGSTDVALIPSPPLAGWEPDRQTMQMCVLGNGHLASVVTADGGGGLHWRGVALTRWSPDPVSDTGGVWIYLRDTQRGETLGATPAPVGDWPADARVQFVPGAVEFSRRDGELAIHTRVTVVSGDDVELREIEIANEGAEPRSLRVVGCLEPVLQAEGEAARHPAFSRMFLRCQASSDRGEVIVSRRDREGRPAPVLVFRMIADAGAEPRVLEIDRGRFLGRRGSFRSPDAIAAGVFEPGHRDTIDPLCVCAADLEIAPGARHVVSLVTAVASSRDEALELAGRFSAPVAVRWAFEDAARAASRLVERVGMTGDLVPVAQRMASAALAPERAVRASEAVLASARPAQPGLWARGISGDEPIVVLRMSSDSPSALFDDALDVHRYLRALGLSLDLVVIDDAPSGYASHPVEAVLTLLAKHDATGLLHQRGGVHVVPADQARGAELTNLAAAARVYLEAGAGSLAAQLEKTSAAPVELPAFLPAGPPPGTAPNPPLEVEIPELEFDNGAGGFDGDEYVIRPGACPPAPWINVIANEELGCLVSEAALGCTWAGNAGENRLTPWHNDPVTDRPSEALYIRDEETARLWTTTPLPAGVPTLVRHGQGYTSYELACEGLEQRMVVFVPPDEPVKVVRFFVRNASARPRRLTATYYLEWVLGTRRAITRPYIRTSLSAGDACLLAETSWSMDFADRAAFVASDHPLHQHSTDRREVIGRGGDMSRPAALGRWGLSGRSDPGADPCAALQVHVEVGPGQERELCFFVGQSDDRERALELVRRMREPGAVEDAWRRCRAFWDRQLDAVRIRTPDAALDRLCNRWLLYQSLSSRFFGRAAFYQSSGAFGFRDQLQDSLALLHGDPDLARAHLLECAAHQFVEGDVLHWWHPPGGAGVRTRCSDDLLWLVYATYEYVAATGDRAVLEERAPLLDGEPLGAGQEVSYGRFASSQSATLLDHCRRALTRGSVLGAHGLPRIGDGDWNDGMNRVGAAGRGESVWLGWFLHACTERFARLLEIAGEPGEAAQWRERLGELERALAEEGWDGSWYLRAIHDDGSAIGSAHGAPPHIDSIAQSWAVLSGAGRPEQVERALAVADRLLVREDDRLVLLLAPPFGPRGPDPGYIAAYPAGVRENGGQYTHAAAWLGWAHAARGDGDAAYRIASLLNPLERTRTADGVARYAVEPYVLAADVYARPPRIGRGGWTWYTGAAAWTWRLVVEAICGLRREDGALVVEPCLPEAWPGFEAWVRDGELAVHVIAHNRAGEDGVRARLDGAAIDRPRVELGGAGERTLELWLGS